VVVEESDAIPEQISSGRLQKQSTLAYRKFGSVPIPERRGTSSSILLW
jgi:hypothetical protein